MGIKNQLEAKPNKMKNYLNYLLNLVPPLLSIIFLIILFGFFEGIFGNEIDKKILFKEEKLLIVVIIFSLIFAALNTFFYAIDVMNFSKCLSTTNYKLRWLATSINIVTMLCFFALGIAVFSLASSTIEGDKDTLYKYLNNADYFSAVIFFVFILIDRGLLFVMRRNENSIADGAERQFEAKTEYYKNSIYMIDIPTVLGLLTTIFLNHFLVNKNFLGLTEAGKIFFEPVLKRGPEVIQQVISLSFS